MFLISILINGISYLGVADNLSQCKDCSSGYPNNVTTLEMLSTNYLYGGKLGERERER